MSTFDSYNIIDAKNYSAVNLNINDAVNIEVDEYSAVNVNVDDAVEL
jgi:hypothetical protein